jgi:S-formylglutathione hydrolase FrmB
MVRAQSCAALRAACLTVASLLAAGALLAQQPPAGRLERIKVHGASLEGNLEGDDPTRDVVVYLPPSYARERGRRYPVIYFLHGYTARAEDYVRFLGLPETADAAFAAGACEAIIVLPDAFTVYSGSMYSSSATTGDWERYVADDLPAYIDAHYRTRARRESRGLAGHSMGGYGTLRIGMKRPEAFGALYAMSSCCLMNDPARGGDAILRAARERANAQGGGAALPTCPSPGGGFANALCAQAAAWAPNPDNAPRYFDFPFNEQGEVEPAIAAKWLANSPLVMVDQYATSLARYGGKIALDVGDSDPLAADNVRFDAALRRLRVEHGFERYEGDHMNRVRERFERHVLPFFSRELEY